MGGFNVVGTLLSLALLVLAIFMITKIIKKLKKWSTNRYLLIVKEGPIFIETFFLAYGKVHNCHHISLTTFSYQAPEFYKKCGYSELGQIQNFPLKGVEKNFFVKYL